MTTRSETSANINKQSLMINVPLVLIDETGQEHDLKDIVRTISSTDWCPRCQSNTLHYAGRCATCRQ